MPQPLPTGEFCWVEFRKDWNPKTIVEELAAKKNYRYLLEVDVGILKIYMTITTTYHSCAQK